ncbi:hypothetical protein [Streptomyces sp. NPDC050856]|uniref:hypothetical protein n=1 Tax=Streptomyces sp. NPDC050856 TaxID=3154939 RepID=UPI0033EF4C8D
MELAVYIDDLRRQLAVAANAGGDEARALADRLTGPLESAARLTILNALAAASEEITRALAPGSVDVRLRGLDPEFTVRRPPVPATLTGGATTNGATMAPVTPPAIEADEGTTARISFRLPVHLKTRVEDAASQEALSVNAWLLRAVATALEPGAPAGSPPPGPRHGRSHPGGMR